MASSEVDPLSIDNITNLDNSNSEKVISRLEQLSMINPSKWSDKDVELIKKLQQSGLPNFVQKNRMQHPTAKILPEILCTCPQRCDEKVPIKVRSWMFKYYHALKDKSKQEELLLKFIEMKSVTRRLAEENKRVQCRYKAPVVKSAINFIFQDDSVILSEDEDDDSQPKNKKHKRDSTDDNISHEEMKYLKSEPNIKYKVDKNGTTEVCQKAFMNVFLVPEKRVRAVREKLVASKRLHKEKEMAENQEFETTVMIARDLAAGCKPLLEMFNQKADSDEGSFDINNQLLSAIDSDIELVNNFFYNQLWKPEFFESLVNGGGGERGGKKFNESLSQSLIKSANTTLNDTTINNSTIDTSVVDTSMDTSVAVPESIDESKDTNENCNGNGDQEVPNEPDSDLTDKITLENTNEEQSSALNLSTPKIGSNNISSSLTNKNSSKSLFNGNMKSSAHNIHSSSKSPNVNNGVYQNGTSTHSNNTQKNSNKSYPLKQNNSKVMSSEKNILNSFMSNSNMMNLDNDLSKYLNGLESSISITSKSASSQNKSKQQFNAASLTAQLIQNALNNQTSISVTATASTSMASKYCNNSLNQILNIPDSVSITPTLVDNSKS